MTTCKSNFLRTPPEKNVLHCFEEKNKKKQRMYELAYSKSKLRDNDYNPLLWQANMDIQFPYPPLSKTHIKDRPHPLIKIYHTHHEYNLNVMNMIKMH